MNSNVHVVTFILLSLEYVAGCSSSWTFHGDIELKKPSTEKPPDVHDLEGNLTCSSPNLNHLWNQSYQNGKINEEPTTLQYNEKKNVSFSCRENEYINKTKYILLDHVGYTKSNMTKSGALSTHQIFNVTDNGTILCCIYYVMNGTAEKKWISLHVANKTLLLYNDTSQQDALGGKENFSNSTITETGNLHAETGNQTIIVIIAVAVVFILLVIAVICRKRCRKKPESDVKVLYADLDILREIEPDSIPRPEEESPYAQIIGEIRN